MLEVFPQEEITKNVKASLDLLVSAFVSLAEQIVNEEDSEQDENLEK